ncbi:MAG: GNAT family N-acetyltransferase [Firmicutes bacterium]|nr:GNAT family N-acetyltransferase [Bacillota bacterium]
MITFRKAAIDDLEQVAHLMVRLHNPNNQKGELTYEESVQEFPYFLNKGVFFVACDLDKIVAYVHGVIRTDYVEGSEQYRDPKVGYIESLFVLPAYRKQGIAKKLCSMLEAWSFKQGARELGSDAYAKNKSSIEFHTKGLGMSKSKNIVHFIKKLK